jgi:protein phosphatase
MVPPITLRAEGATDVGLRRPHNEDAFLCNRELGLFIVADGVGGNAKGEVASQESVEQIDNFIRRGRRPLDLLHATRDPALRAEVRRLLEGAVQNACYMVYGLGELDPAQRGMSTTISALLLAEDYGVTAQVGDSRIYRLRGGQVSQLTEDHTLVNYKLKQGLITPSQARTMKERNVITRAVGQRDYVEVDVQEIDVREGDRYLLCSDGLHGYLADGELERLLGEEPLAAAPGRFIELANSRGGRDNITVVVVAAETEA